MWSCAAKMRIKFLCASTVLIGTLPILSSGDYKPYVSVHCYRYVFYENTGSILRRAGKLVWARGSLRRKRDTSSSLTARITWNVWRRVCWKRDNNCISKLTRHAERVWYSCWRMAVFRRWQTESLNFTAQQLSKAGKISSWSEDMKLGSCKRGASWQIWRGTKVCNLPYSDWQRNCILQ